MINIPLTNKNLGKLYTHAAPFLKENMDNEWDEAEISTTISLLEKDFHEEQIYYARMDVINYPIQDYGLPSNNEDFDKLVEKIIRKLQGKENVSIHCYMGNGRTGLLTAILYAILEDIPGKEAIKKIRNYKGKYVENEAQQEYVINFVDRWKDEKRVIQENSGVSRYKS